MHQEGDVQAVYGGGVPDGGGSVESRVQSPSEAAGSPPQASAERPRGLIGILVVSLLLGIVLVAFVTLLERPPQYAEPELVEPK